MEVDAVDASLNQGLEFAGLADAIPVGILPDQQPGIVGIQQVDLAVAVAVVFGEFVEAVPAGGAEEVAQAVHHAVVVGVEDEQTVLRGDPAGFFCDAVVVEIEVGARLGAAEGVDLAVVVEIQRQRIDPAARGVRVVGGRLGRVQWFFFVEVDAEIAIGESIDGESVVDGQRRAAPKVVVADGVVV